MLKVCKFGGTSMADACAMMKVRDIIKADEDRKYICDEMRAQHPNIPIETCEIGMVLTIHLGPGLIAIFVRKKA